MTNSRLTLTLIRHAPTSENRRKVFMGVSDVPLSKDGELMAEQTRERCAVFDFSVIFCSPLVRAMRTAAIVFPKRVLCVDNRLIERNLGDWAGRPKAEIRKKYPEAFDEDGRLDPSYCPRGGEIIEDFCERVEDFLYHASRMVPVQPKTVHLAAVTHNGVIRAMRSIIENRGQYNLFDDEESHLEPRTYEVLNGVWRPSLTSPLDY